jgi:signal transduction histidine kinase
MSVPSTYPILNSRTPPARQTLRYGWAGLSLLTTLALGGAAAWVYSRGCGIYWDISTSTVVSSLLSITAYASLGSLLMIYRPDNRIGWICSFCGLGLGLVMVSSMGLPCALATSDPWWGLPYLGWFVYTFVAFPGILPQFVLLPLLYPNGRFLSPAWAKATGIGIVASVASSVALGLLPDFRRHNGVTFSMDLDNPFGIAGLPEWWHPLWMGATVILLCALCFLGMAAVAVRFRRSTGDERQQMKWLAYFLGTVVAVQLLVFEIPGNLFAPQIFHTVWYDLIIWGVQLGFPLTIAIAIFKYRLYDIDLIINRTLVYGALTLMVVALYGAIVFSVSRILHDENNLIASLFATATIAIVFQPARERLQRSVNRWLFGERDDPAGVLARLTGQLEAADSGASLLSSLVAMIASSLKLPYVAVWMREADGTMEVAAQTGQPPNDVERLPLLHQQESIGTLVIAPRTPGESLDAADRSLLLAIARLVATTARTIQLTSEVQEARVRTVSAREEERRRLRRDLHDGLGPVLASQGLKLAAARQLLRQRPEVAERLLDEVMNQGESTVAEVRRLVYALRPPTLDELGLVEAIREHVDSLGAATSVAISVDAPKTLPEIPAAIEVAVFRIVQEALSNVIRHARAQHCRIVLQINGHLEVLIEDDGIGLPEGMRSGIGLISMRERAAEVGGVCQVERGAFGGVSVRLSLPLAK